MKKRDEIYGFKTSDVVENLGKVLWPKGKPKTRHEKYVSKVLSFIKIPKDTGLKGVCEEIHLQIQNI